MGEEMVEDRRVTKRTASEERVSDRRGRLERARERLMGKRRCWRDSE